MSPYDPAMIVRPSATEQHGSAELLVTSPLTTPSTAESSGPKPPAWLDREPTADDPCPEREGENLAAGQPAKVLFLMNAWENRRQKLVLERLVEKNWSTALDRISAAALEQVRAQVDEGLALGDRYLEDFHRRQCT
jgi:hypothetical protein